MKQQERYSSRVQKIKNWQTRCDWCIQRQKRNKQGMYSEVEMVEMEIIENGWDIERLKSEATRIVELMCLEVKIQ